MAYISEVKDNACIYIIPGRIDVSYKIGREYGCD